MTLSPASMAGFSGIIGTKVIRFLWKSAVDDLYIGMLVSFAIGLSQIYHCFCLLRQQSLPCAGPQSGLGEVIQIH